MSTSTTGEKLQFMPTLRASAEQARAKSSVQPGSSACICEPKQQPSDSAPEPPSSRLAALSRGSFASPSSSANLRRSSCAGAGRNSTPPTFNSPTSSARLSGLSASPSTQKSWPAFSCALIPARRSFTQASRPSSK